MAPQRQTIGKNVGLTILAGGLRRGALHLTPHDARVMSMPSPSCTGAVLAARLLRR